MNPSPILRGERSPPFLNTKCVKNRSGMDHWSMPERFFTHFVFLAGRVGKKKTHLRGGGSPLPEAEHALLPRARNQIRIVLKVEESACSPQRHFQSKKGGRSLHH